MTKIFMFLALFNCHPQSVPVIPSNSTFFLEGIVYVSPDMMHDYVLVHEYYHACQYEWAGRKGAATWKEWHWREQQAKEIEIKYLEWKDYHDELDSKVYYQFKKAK